MTALARALGATLAVLALAPTTHAAPPDLQPWRDALVATGVVPEACADTLVAFLRVAEPPRGTPLVRTAPPDALTSAVLTKLDRGGGVPYLDDHGRIVRLRSTVSADGYWAPADTRRASLNRGYALLALDGERRLLVVDHMESPITAATSLWEDAGTRVVERARFPGEVVATEAVGDELRLVVADPLTAASVAWDRTRKVFVGRCLVRDANTLWFDEAPAAVLLAATPTLVTLARGGRVPLHLGPGTEGDAAPPIVGHVASGARIVALLVTPAGWTLALVPHVDRTPLAALFVKVPRATWRIGWLAPGAAPGRP